MPTFQTMEAQPNVVGRRARARTTVQPATGTSTTVVSAKAKRNRKRRVTRKERRLANMMNDLSIAAVPNTTRDGLMYNPADPRTTIAKLGRTRTGADWCLKALHPNGELNVSVPKIPDGAASESVVMERRDEFVIRNPLDQVIGGGLKDGDTWTIVLLSFPFLRFHTLAIASLYVMTQGELEKALRYALANPGESNQWITDPDATSPYMSAWMRSPILDPKTLDTDDSGINPFGEFFKTIRRTFCGYTVDFDANTLTDKGRVTTGQFQSVVDIRALTYSVERTVKITGGATGETATVQDVETRPAYVYQAPPMQTEEIVQSDSKCRQAEARTGDYMPLRLWQPTTDFVPVTASRALTVFDDTTSSQDNPTTIYKNPPTLWFDGWGTGVWIFSDIDKSSSLRIKRREGLEMVVGYESPYGTFDTPAYSPDPIAQDIVREFSRTQPHSYPADFNSKNTLQRGLFGELGNVLGNLGLPIVSDLAPLLGGLLDGIL